MPMLIRTDILPLLMLAVLVVLSGCTPSISPLYRDYEVAHTPGLPDQEVLERIDRGLQAAGWTVVDGVTDNTVATELRTMRRWFFYDVQVQMEAVPMGGDYVRLLIHPYRELFNGRRRQIPYLRGSLARAVLRDLKPAFEAEGLIYVGTAQSRDRADRGD
jgi:hypothetical protein